MKICELSKGFQGLMVGGGCSSRNWGPTKSLKRVPRSVMGQLCLWGCWRPSSFLLAEALMKPSYHFGREMRLANISKEQAEAQIVRSEQTAIPNLWADTSSMPIMVFLWLLTFTSPLLPDSTFTPLPLMTLAQTSFIFHLLFKCIH